MDGMYAVFAGAKGCHEKILIFGHAFVIRDNETSLMLL
jgi:hypothetical protein